ncbi:MAG: nitrite reductase [Bacteroidetes bacterium 4572_117]|nr:MAG: nitrite reductase [Bacteroidetes bacterium 4572_117]
MKEELIVSGRMNLNIDPVLNAWHWQIPLYLFLGGLAAGVLFFATLYFIRNESEKYSTAVKIAPIIAPIAIALGLVALILDLKHKLYFWQLYTTIRLDSPMSWGAWVLMLVMPLSIIWVATYLKEVFPKIELKKGFFAKIFNIFLKPVENNDVNWDWKFKWLSDFELLMIKNRKPLAWVLLVTSVILGVYTGILLSAFNARPLWNNAILGPLFLVSGLSTGAASIMWLSKNHEEQKLFSKIDILLIVVELFFIIHLFMGFLAGPQVQIEAANLFFGGEFTIYFGLFVVVLGLIMPAIFEIMELNGYRIHVAIPAILILFGGLLFRFVMVEAGQITRYLY